MNKSILKVLIDTVKYGDGYKTRPGLAGAVITEHQHEGEKSYLYCSNGYSLIRLECGGPLCMPFNDSIFWPLDKMEEEYRKVKKGEKAMISGAIHKNKNAGLTCNDFTYNNRDFSAPDYKALIYDIEKRAEGEGMANNMALDFGLLKTIAPLGRLNIEILSTGGAKVLKAEGEGVLFIQMGLAS